MKRYIDNEGRFYNGRSIVLGDLRIFNPTEKQLEEAGYTEYVEPVVELTDEEKKEIELKSAKDDLIQKIRQYDASENVNSFTIDGTNMWLDVDERNQLMASLDAYRKVNATEMTKWYNGVKYTFSLDTWSQMLAMLIVYASESLNATEQHLANADALASVEDVEAYDYTQGYPAKLIF